MSARAMVVVLSCSLVACASAPRSDGSVVVRLRVRDDLAPIAVATETDVPDEEPLCDEPGPDGLEVVDLDAGHTHGCVALSDGHVRCWGENWAGQLGDGTYANTATPTTVRDVAGATAVGAGRAHSCAIVEGGRVRCWGQNDHGQLGAGSRGGRVGPTAVEAVGLRGIAQLGVGWDHTCAVTDRGRVYCWGRNHLGQLGDGTRTLRAGPTEVRDLRASYVGAGVDSTCAVATDGRVACWGGLAIAERPRFVDGLPIAAVSVEVGEASACARLVDGSVWCWGDGTHGQLGPAAHGASERPILVEGLPPALTLSVSATRACIVDAERQLWCWGAREPGNVEAGSPRVISHMSAAEDAAIASDATCTRLTRGGICCWGENGGGMLGALVHPFRSPAESAALPVPMAW